MKWSNKRENLKKGVHTFLCNGNHGRLELDVVADSSIESSDATKGVRDDEVRVLQGELADGLINGRRELLKHRMVDEVSEVVERGLRSCFKNKT
jgi:hypothetical protein